MPSLLPAAHVYATTHTTLTMHCCRCHLCPLQGVLGRAAAQQCYLEALRLDMLYAPAWRGLGDLLRESGELVQVRAGALV
jgi:hypothetical protein